MLSVQHRSLVVGQLCLARRWPVGMTRKVCIANVFEPQRWCASIGQSFNSDSAAKRIRLSTLETCTDLMNLEGSSTDSRVLFRTELIFPPTAALIFRAFSVFAGVSVLIPAPR